MENRIYYKVKSLGWFKENVFCSNDSKLTNDEKIIRENFMNLNCSIWPKRSSYDNIYECPDSLLSMFCRKKFYGRLGTELMSYPGFYNFTSSNISMWFHKSYFYIIDRNSILNDIMKYCNSGYCIRECDGCVLEKYKDEN